jgi:creatinine amidohydrolase/Fe(II)-dependent formamide hydrolase-like protein
MLLAIDPDRVIMELAEPGDVHPLPELIEALRANGVRGTSANGVLGDPTTANPTVGQALLERLTDDLVALVEAGGR